MNKKESNDLQATISQAIQEMKKEAGDAFDLDRINLAELQRRTGISRKRLRNLKKNGFVVKQHGLSGIKRNHTVLSGYTDIIDALLRKGVTNSSAIKDRLVDAGYSGGLTQIKEYITSHKHLIPAKRQTVAPQGSRGRRYTSAPGSLFAAASMPS